MAVNAVKRRGISIRLACEGMGISPTGYFYKPKLSSENEHIVDWLLRLTTADKRCGFCSSFSLPEER